MGGHISIESEVGKGSIFTLALMLPKVNKHLSEPEYAKSKVVGYLGERKSILIVDDDVSQREFMFDLLSPLGFDLHLVGRAKDGLEVLENIPIHMALLDITMPEMDGWEMAKIIRERKLTMPVMMLSAVAINQISQLPTEMNHNDYLAKPINIDNLLGKVGHHLDIEWMYQFVQEETLSVDDENNHQLEQKQIQALLDNATIGHLSGFMTELETIQNTINKDVFNKLKTYAQGCNFPDLIEYLNQLSDELAEVPPNE